MPGRRKQTTKAKRPARSAGKSSKKKELTPGQWFEKLVAVQARLARANGPGRQQAFQTTGLGLIPSFSTTCRRCVPVFSPSSSVFFGQASRLQSFSTGIKQSTLRCHPTFDKRPALLCPHLATTQIGNP